MEFGKHQQKNKRIIRAKQEFYLVLDFVRFRIHL